MARILIKARAACQGADPVQRWPGSLNAEPQTISYTERV